MNHFIRNLENADAQGMKQYINDVTTIVNNKCIDEIARLSELGASLPRGEHNQDLQILSRSLKTFPDHMEADIEFQINECKTNYDQCKTKEMRELNG